MADSVFPSTTRCQMVPVPAIPPGRLIINGEIPDPPPDIPDCHLLPPPNLPPVPPCPAITIDGGTGQTVELLNFCDENGKQSVGLTLKQSDCCGFDFHFEASGFCPTISIAKEVPPCEGGQVELVGTPGAGNAVQLPPCSDPGFNFSLTKADEGCAFDFDLAIQFPCPCLSEGAVKQTQGTPGTDGKLDFTLTPDPGGGCAFSFDFDITFPCPEVNANPVTTKEQVPGSPPSVTLGVTPSATECAFDLDLNIDFPCPTITSKSTITTGAIGSTATGGITINPSKVACSFEIDFNVTVPGSCSPAVTGSGDVTLLPVGATPYVDVDVFQPDECAFDLAIHVGIPRGAGARPGRRGSGSGTGGACPCIKVSDLFTCDENGNFKYRDACLTIDDDFCLVLVDNQQQPEALMAASFDAFWGD